MRLVLTPILVDAATVSGSTRILLPRRLLKRIRRLVAHRDILRRRAILVAFGVEADTSSWDEFDDLVEDDPNLKLRPQASRSHHRHLAPKLGREDALRYQCVDAPHDVHHLGHAEAHRDAAQGVGVELTHLCPGR